MDLSTSLTSKRQGWWQHWYLTWKIIIGKILSCHGAPDAGNVDAFHVEPSYPFQVTNMILNCAFDAQRYPLAAFGWRGGFLRAALLVLDVCASYAHHQCSKWGLRDQGCSKWSLFRTSILKMGPKRPRMVKMRSFQDVDTQNEAFWRCRCSKWAPETKNDQNEVIAFVLVCLRLQSWLPTFLKAFDVIWLSFFSSTDKYG